MSTNKTDPVIIEFKSFEKLFQAMRDEPVINKKVIGILKMDSFRRRLVLNNWLEQLRQNNAPQKLMQTLSCLFDDLIAEKVLINISKQKTL